MTTTPLSPEEYEERADLYRWEVLIAPNRQLGESWRRKLYDQGILIKGKDVYTLNESRRWHGARFTKVYLTPRIADCGSIRGVLERAQALMQLQRGCALTRGFEGFVIIGEGGFISAPSKTL